MSNPGWGFDIQLEQPTMGATVTDSFVNMADAIHADLIVLGSRGRPAPVASLFGSVSREVARAAHVPVLIVRDAAQQRGLPARLLLVVTQETLGSTEPDTTFELARGLGARVTILHVHGLLEDAVKDLLRVPATLTSCPARVGARTGTDSLVSSDSSVWRS